jgi:hypothetical protein
MELVGVVTERIGKNGCHDRLVTGCLSLSIFYCVSNDWQSMIPSDPY